MQGGMEEGILNVDAGGTNEGLVKEKGVTQLGSIGVQGDAEGAQQAIISVLVGGEVEQQGGTVVPRVVKDVQGLANEDGEMGRQTLSGLVPTHYSHA